MLSIVLLVCENIVFCNFAFLLLHPQWKKYYFVVFINNLAKHAYINHMQKLHYSNNRRGQSMKIANSVLFSLYLHLAQTLISFQPSRMPNFIHVASKSCSYKPEPVYSTSKCNIAQFSRANNKSSAKKRWRFPRGELLSILTNSRAHDIWVWKKWQRLISMLVTSRSVSEVAIMKNSVCYMDDQHLLTFSALLRSAFRECPTSIRRFLVNISHTYQPHHSSCTESDRQTEGRMGGQTDEKDTERQTDRHRKTNETDRQESGSKQKQQHVQKKSCCSNIP